MRKNREYEEVIARVMRKTVSKKKNALVFTTALATALFAYGRRAYADCTIQSSPDYLCSGATTTSQTASVNDAHVYTDNTFNLNVSTGNGITISGAGAISFTDTNHSSMSAIGDGLTISSTADNGMTAGSVDVDINGDLSTGGFAINAHNGGSGALTIASTGDILSDSVPIFAVNSAAGTDLTIKVADVEGHFGGGSNYGAIHATNNGSGDLYIGSTGDVYGGRNGIAAFNYNAGNGDLIIDVDGNVTGHNYRGIDARQRSTGDLSITVGGDITAHEHGIVARNLATSGGMYIDVEGDINADSMGIVALQRGTGPLEINTAGHITGTLGIRALVYAASSTYIHVNDITATTSSGIYVRNYSGTMDILVDGDINAYQSGVQVQSISSDAGDVTVTTAAGSSVTSTYGNGVFVQNVGAGATTLNINGDVYGYSVAVGAGSTSGKAMTINVAKGVSVEGHNAMGIYAGNIGSSLAITIGAGATVTGASGGAISDSYSGGHIDTAGTITGTTGTAISLSLLSSEMDINILGGQIVGDVVDDAPTNGYSTVNVAANFTSEGNFYVSNFNVAKGMTFTLGNGFTVDASNGIDVSGTFLTPDVSSITGDVDVLATGLLDVRAATGITGSLANNGAVSIASGTTLSTDTMQAGKGTLTFGVVSAADHGALVINNGAANLTGQKVVIDLASVNTVDASTKFLLIDGDATAIGGPGSNGTKVADNSLAWDFTMINGAGITNDSDIFLMASKATFGSTPNDASAGDALISLDGTSDPELSGILDNLTNATTPAEQAAIIEAVQPAMDGANVTATLTFADSAMNLTGERLRDLRMGDSGTTGVSAGTAGLGNRSWVQVTGWDANQGRRDGIAGYDATTFAATMGADTEKLLPHGIVGLAFSYGTTNINSRNVTRTGTDIDSYQLTLYSDYSWGKGYYLTSMAGYAFNTNSTVRHDVGGTPGLTAYGDFNSQQVALRAETGRAYQTQGFFLTPMALADWVYYKADDYSETGAGGAGLHVASKGLNALDLGVGGKAAMNFNGGDGSRLTPEISAAYRYDVLGDNLETSSSFLGGGPAFKGESPNPARHKVTLGAQLKYYSADNLELTAAYNFDIKQDYIANAALLRAGWKF